MSYSSSCQHHQAFECNAEKRKMTPSSLAPIEFRMKTFWYQLTQIHLENSCYNRQTDRLSELQ